MGATLMLMRNPTAARPLLLLLLLRHATVARPLLLQLLLLPRHATAAHAPPRPENHGRRQEHGGAGVPPTHTPPAIVSQFYGPYIESRWNGWCFLVSGGSVGGRPRLFFHGIVTFRELAENDLNNIRFTFLDPDSMHRCLEAGNAGKENVGVFVPHELNSLQLRHK